MRGRLAVLAGATCLLGQAAAAAGLDEITPLIQRRLYSKSMIDPAQPVAPSAYRDWKPRHSPPWTLGYASSYDKNTWRASVIERLRQRVLPKWRALGLVKDVIVTQSNLDDALQAKQIREMVDQGVDAVIVCCSNPTALNDTVKYAFDHGVPTFSLTGYLTSPYAVNASVNFQLAGYQIGNWMAEELGEAGNVLVVEGIPGTSASDSQTRGVKAGLGAYPDMRIVGSLSGMWTDDAAEQAVRQFLATHADKVDGVIVQSASEMGVLKALKEAGRAVPVTLGGELGALCHWRHNPRFVSGAYHVWPPGDDFELVWTIAMRTLEGQGPKLQSILVDPVKLTPAVINKMLPADCDEAATGWLEVGPENWGGPAYLDQFFLHPADPEHYAP